MATSSGNSSGSSTLQIVNSGSDQEGLQQVMDQRKRKRMVSNRESARRSRMRKQEHLTDLTAQAGLLKKENNQILTSMNLTNQLYLNLEAENSVLRAQIAELSNRLHSLNDIIDCIDSTKWLLDTEEEQDMTTQFGGDGFLNPWSNLSFNQPVDMFMC